MKDKDKIEELEALEETKYENIDLDHLMMYVMGQLERIGANLSYENAVVAAFKIFPKKFSLPGFQEYPDSNRVEQCLWRCAGKTRQWLGGKSRQGFIITDRSRLIIKEAGELLSGTSHKKTKATSKTRRKETILAEVVSSTAYTKYVRGEGSSITKGEFCFLLQGTLDSSKETLRENFNSLKIFAEELAHKDILKFLNWLEEHFKKILSVDKK